MIGNNKTEKCNDGVIWNSKEHYQVFWGAIWQEHELNDQELNVQEEEEGKIQYADELVFERHWISLQVKENNEKN